MYENCTLCPRVCGVNRNEKFGYCKMSAELYVSRAAPHFWEEPSISGKNGSGTVFFSGCSLRCVYCQNSEISNGINGKKISTSRLSEIFLELQAKGVHNINLVTPDHYVYHITEAITSAKENGLKIPIVYNTSGYCALNTLRLLDGLVDIYLTDFKYITPEISEKYSNCRDYGECAKIALSEMIRQCGEPIFEDGLMKKGVIIRHLCLPHNVAESKRVLDFINTYNGMVYYSIMNQYTPVKHFDEFSELNRKLKLSEYERVLNYAEKIGMKNIYIQEGETQSESFIPPFDNEGV